MSWLTDDPEVLRVVLDAVDSWDESDMDTTSSCDEHWRVPPTIKNPTPPSRQPSTRKTRSRGNRRKEILELRTRAASMEKDLELLHQHAESQLANGHARWEQQARQELSARRQSELQNSWLRTTLTRHVKTTRRLARLLNQIKFTATEPPLLKLESQDGTAEFDDSNLTTEILDKSPTDATEIQMNGTWSFQGSSPSSVEDALWTLFRSDHMQTTESDVDCEIVASDDTSIAISFRIATHGGFQFRGGLLVRRDRDPRSGELCVTLTSQTVPLGDHTDDAFAEATCLEDETTYRVRCQSSLENRDVCTELVIARQYRLHAKAVGRDHRLELARSIVTHVNEEMQWMHSELILHTEN